MSARRDVCSIRQFTARYAWVCSLQQDSMGVQLQKLQQWLLRVCSGHCMCSVWLLEFVSDASFALQGLSMLCVKQRSTQKLAPSSTVP